MEFVALALQRRLRVLEKEKEPSQIGRSLKPVGLGKEFAGLEWPPNLEGTSTRQKPEPGAKRQAGRRRPPCRTARNSENRGNILNSMRGTRAQLPPDTKMEPLKNTLQEKKGAGLLSGYHLQSSRLQERLSAPSRKTRTAHRSAGIRKDQGLNASVARRTKANLCKSKRRRNAL